MKGQGSSAQRQPRRISKQGHQHLSTQWEGKTVGGQKTIRLKKSSRWAICLFAHPKTPQLGLTKAKRNGDAATQGPHRCDDLSRVASSELRQHDGAGLRLHKRGLAEDSARRGRCSVAPKHAQAVHCEQRAVHLLGGGWWRRVRGSYAPMQKGQQDNNSTLASFWMCWLQHTVCYCTGSYSERNKGCSRNMGTTAPSESVH